MFSEARTRYSEVLKGLVTTMVALFAAMPCIYIHVCVCVCVCVCCGKKFKYMVTTMVALVAAM